jgi:hypothetical protein
VSFHELRLGDRLIPESHPQSFDETVELNLPRILLVLEQGDLFVGQPLAKGDGNAKTGKSFVVNLGFPHAGAEL